MTFETEYQFDEFMRFKDENFDDTGKAYAGTPISHSAGEQMLKLILQMKFEIDLLEKTIKDRRVM